MWPVCGSQIGNVGFGPDLLPGASGVFHLARFDVVVCCSCGLTRFFAPRETVDKVAKSALWEKP